MIKNLQQKIQLISNSADPNSFPNKYSNAVHLESNENLAKHKESEIKKLKYELELA